MTLYSSGIPDIAFFRDDVPMTKQEVRAISLSKLQVKQGNRCLDIGCGSGSVSVEMALATVDGEVVAVDSDSVALKVTAINLERFEVDSRVRTIEGIAPAALRDIGFFDRIFIGGSNGSLSEIMRELPSICLANETRVVVNAICLETVAELLSSTKSGPWCEVEVVEVHLARGVAAGSKTRFVPLSPVWVVSFTYAGSKGGAA